MNKPKVYELEFYDEKYNIVLGKTTYNNNGTIAVLMFVSTPKGKIKEDFGTLTVNINDSNIYANKDKRQFIDTNNNGREIVKWLTKNNIAKPTHIYGISGFCTYPLVEFTEEALSGMADL